MVPIFIIALIILIIIIIITYVFKNPDINGFWQASSDYCQQADLELFCLYIYNDSGYLFAANKAGVIANEEVKITRSFSKITLTTSLFLHDVVIDTSTCSTGKIKIVNDNTLYAVLYRNNEYSDK